MAHALPPGHARAVSVVVHINGWPGSGKLTIARLLADRLGARLIDNHLLLNPAEALFRRGEPGHAMLYAETRALVLRHAATLPANLPLVFTDALSDDAADTARFAACESLALARGNRCVSVVLEVDATENERRLAAPDRASHHKLTDADVLRGMRARYRLLRPPGCRVIDVTHLAPADAAEALIAAM